jgi:hypothetical protein
MNLMLNPGPTGFVWVAIERRRMPHVSRHDSCPCSQGTKGLACAVSPIQWLITTPLLVGL